MFRAVCPDRWRHGEVWQCCHQWINEFPGHNEMPGRDDIDTVGQRATDKIGVEQGYYAADTRDAKPYGEILGAIRHQKTDDFTFGEILLKCPACVLVRALGERSISHGLAVGQQCRCIAGASREFLDDRRHDTVGIARDWSGQFQGTQPGFGGRSGRLSRSLLLNFYHAVFPASTVRTVPVIFFALSLRRNSTAFATSSISARRRSALRRSIF